MSGSELESIVQQRLQFVSANQYELKIVQEPKDGKAVNKPDKARGPKCPLDPPPVIEFTIKHGDAHGTYMHSPYWFCSAKLECTTADHQQQPQADNVTGSLVSSLHKVKMHDNKEHAFFIFGDLIAKAPGQYRAHFTLHEMRMSQLGTGSYAEKLCTVTTSKFQVHPAKQPMPIRESTPLSKMLCEAGVKIRIRKETGKRKREVADWSAEKAQALYGPPGLMAPPGMRANSYENVTHRITYGEGLGIRNHLDAGRNNSHHGQQTLHHAGRDNSHYGEQFLQHARRNDSHYREQILQLDQLAYPQAQAQQQIVLPSTEFDPFLPNGNIAAPDFSTFQMPYQQTQTPFNDYSQEPQSLPHQAFVTQPASGSVI